MAPFSIILVGEFCVTIYMPLFGIFVPYLRGMKQNTEEPDYRSINEVQLKSELIKLEKKILDITDDPSTTSTMVRSGNGAKTIRRSRRSRR